MLLLLFTLQQPAPETAPAAPVAIDFARIERGIATPPKLAAGDPLYGLLLFGLDGEKRMWAVLDRSEPEQKGYDILHLDLDADGDLSEHGERLAGKSAGDAWQFDLPELHDPATGAVHEKFRISWNPDRIGYSMLWRGDKRVMGGYGCDAETYLQFGKSPETAPILVPGYDRPFQFQHWLSGSLTRDKDCQFKVFVGQPGSGPGSFTTVDDKFLPTAEYVVATLRYTARGGDERSAVFRLDQRC